MTREDENVLFPEMPLLPSRPVAGAPSLRLLLREMESTSSPEPIYTELVALWRSEGREIPRGAGHTVLSRRFGPPALERGPAGALPERAEECANDLGDDPSEASPRL